MSDKVKLPREIDKAIITCKEADISDYGIVCLTMFKQDDKGFSPKVFKALEVLRRWTFSDMEDEDIEWKISANDGPSKADELMLALAWGWEVERTPEDEVREYYQQQCKCDTASQEASFRAIQKTLNLLNINIEGVNA